MELKLVLEDDKPVFQGQRRLAIMERKVVNEQVDEWLKNIIIVPSFSNYPSPVVLVKKKTEHIDYV